VSSTARAYDTVIFDFAGVLLDFDDFHAFEGLCPREEVERFFAETGFNTTLAEARDAGAPWSQGRAIVAREQPQWLWHYDTYAAAVRESALGGISGMEDLVRDLKAAGIGVFGLSNWPKEDAWVPPDAAPAINLLDGYIMSGEVGLIKPQAAIFELALERFGIADRRRTLFVDDRPPNITGAEAVGLPALLFRGARPLRTHLEQAGLLTADHQAQTVGPA
jgi:2-haloacid dehalogenase